MKKVILAIAAIAVVVCFSFTSCKKTCTCKSYLDGEVVSTREDVDPQGKKCSEFGEVIESNGKKTGLECK